MRKGVLYLLVLLRHRRRVVVLRRCWHGHIGLHVGSLHVRSTWHRMDETRAPSGLRRVRVARLRLEGRGHTTTLTRSITELVVRRKAHLRVKVVSMGIEATATTTLSLEISSSSSIALC